MGAGDHKTIGPMYALPKEQLAQPIELTCGAIIQEFRISTSQTKSVNHRISVARLNRICTHVQSNFFIFIEARGLKTNHERPFVWNISFLPEASCYRCLNDERYRFYHRFVIGRVLIGYTDYESDYMFVISNMGDPFFDGVFAHELFHSFSMFYGVYDNHPGSVEEKTATDEVLVEEFTRWLGYTK